MHLYSYFCTVSLEERSFQLIYPSCDQWPVGRKLLCNESHVYSNQQQLCDWVFIPLTSFK